MRFSSEGRPQHQLLAGWPPAVSQVSPGLFLTPHLLVCPSCPSTSSVQLPLTLLYSAPTQVCVQAVGTVLVSTACTGGWGRENLCFGGELWKVFRHGNATSISIWWGRTEPGGPERPGGSVRRHRDPSHSTDKKSRSERRRLRS